MPDIAENAPRATEVCQTISLEKASRALLRENLPVFDYIWMLVEREYFPDAVRVMAHVLPKREAVWWACQCARQAPDPEATAEMDAALVAAEKWVSEMSEEARQAAGPAAREADLNTAAGCAAYAAFVSGGSMVPSDMQPLPPPDNLTAQLVAGSVLASSIAPDPSKAPEKFRLFLEQAQELYRNTQSQG